MKSTPSRTKAKRADWPKKIRLGRVTVTVYRRKTPTGSTGYLVANYASGRRRLDAHPTEADALDAAQRLARQLSEREVVAASMTNEHAAEYASAIQALAPFNLPLAATASTVA